MSSRANHMRVAIARSIGMGAAAWAGLCVSCPGARPAPKRMIGAMQAAVMAATHVSRADGSARPGIVTSAPVSAPHAGAKASSPPSSPLCRSGTTSPAQAASGPSIMLSATCQPMMSAVRTGKVVACGTSISSPPDSKSPANTQGRRVPLRSLAQPNRMLAMLAAIAPMNVVTASQWTLAGPAIISMRTGSRMVRKGV